MKITNELKVGAITLIGIACLVFGYNFLKGKRVFSDSTVLYGVYDNVQGLANSNPVSINGLEVGNVYKIHVPKDMRRLIVEMNITKDIIIPDNSIALIKPNPLGNTSIEIKLGTSTTNFKNGDTIITDANGGLFEDMLKKVDPVLYEVKKAVTSIDSVLVSVNKVLDPRARGNIQSTLENLNDITASLTVSAASLQHLLNTQTGAVAQTMNNLNKVTGNLAQNNPRINNIIENLDATTTKFAAVDLQKTMDTLDLAVNQLKHMMDKLNTDSGTLGMLMNDPRLYNNLASTSNKLNLLFDDIRLHPKRYLSISIFGKKAKGEPLMVPLPDTMSSPYIIERVSPN